jgi:hypothetical protein
MLRAAGIPYRVTGGLAVNLLGVGRPTGDVDLIVRKQDWARARKTLQALSTGPQRTRFGLPDEPEEGMTIVGPHGVLIELWPEGVTHGQIARTRGYARKHPAATVPLSLGGDETVTLLNAKLASYLSARDRLSDASDAQRLIRKLGLPLGFKGKLDLRVRAAFTWLWRTVQKRAK